MGKIPKKKAYKKAPIVSPSQPQVDKKKHPSPWLFITPLILLFVSATLFFMDSIIQIQVKLAEVSPVKNAGKISDFPFPIHAIQPYITAKSAIVMDDASKVILYEKNPILRFSMASTTKVMTALTSFDYFGPDDVLTIRRSSVEGTVVGFRPGEQVTYLNMLYAMLLPSGNDAAFAIADNYPGGLDAFVQKMNDKAASLHLYSTHYGDPAGLEDDEDYTTVTDLAKLASYALQNPTLAHIFSTKQKTITTRAGNPYALLNLNKLLGYDGVTGIKTGFTEGAGGVLITSKVENGHTFIIIVMNSEDRFLDTEALLAFVTNNISYVPSDRLGNLLK